jgi:hypothetical protein
LLAKNDGSLPTGAAFAPEILAKSDEKGELSA